MPPLHSNQQGQRLKQIIDNRSQCLIYPRLVTSDMITLRNAALAGIGIVNSLP
ncbi:hypothetical protein [Nitrosomonas sp. Nm58]|uniref:hypothetical protein n=1 Tax=Nitrosomonas sp. Nm58 TaxID=200126 RepID=UPI00210AB951|nr:hypothetical protein [Nitrosomonas sp. Nm58]